MVPCWVGGELIRSPLASLCPVLGALLWAAPGTQLSAMQPLSRFLLPSLPTSLLRDGGEKWRGSPLFSTLQQLISLWVCTGREAEIDRFECCLEAYEHLEEPHVLAFVGIPGSGKSHLLAELAILGRAAGHR